jgi:peroxiredoxin
VVGVSVDPVERDRAMVEKLLLPFSLLADPDATAIKQYGVWDEQGEIARPAIFVIDAAGVVRYVYVGKDFADRPGDEPIFEALEKATRDTQ